MDKQTRKKKGWKRIRNEWKQSIRKMYKRLWAPMLRPLETNHAPQTIISLTSHGSRLNTVRYTLFSLLDQKTRPDKIILWVGHNDKKYITKGLTRLVGKGLEIRFCEDIGSYTKLIYTLEAYPEATVITVDDDIIYHKNWLTILLAKHHENPQKIICYRAHGIKVDENHHPLPYHDWAESIKPEIYFGEEGNSPFSIFPTGVGGVLYPPKCFHKDITNRELFLALAPFADDIWFWAMAVIHEKYADESPYYVIEKKYQKRIKYVDFQSQEEGSALYLTNMVCHENDRQLRAVMAHYPKIQQVLRKIEPTKTQRNI